MNQYQNQKVKETFSYYEKVNFHPMKLKKEYMNPKMLPSHLANTITQFAAASQCENTETCYIY